MVTSIHYFFVCCCFYVPFLHFCITINCKQRCFEPIQYFSVHCFLQLLNFETGEVTRCSNGLSWDEALSDLSCKPTVQTTQVIHTEPGERVTLTCMFMGSPVPRVAWFNPQGIFIQGGIQSQSGKLSDLRVSGPQWVRGKSGYNQWLNLTIPKVTEKHIGDYKVRNIESRAPNIFSYDS